MVFPSPTTTIAATPAEVRTSSEPCPDLTAAIRVGDVRTGPANDPGEPGPADGVTVDSRLDQLGTASRRLYRTLETHSVTQPDGKRVVWAGTTDIAGELGKAVGTISEQLKRLEVADLITRSGRGRIHINDHPHTPAHTSGAPVVKGATTHVTAAAEPPDDDVDDLGTPHAERTDSFWSRKQSAVATALEQLNHDPQHRELYIAALETLLDTRIQTCPEPSGAGVGDTEPRLAGTANGPATSFAVTANKKAAVQTAELGTEHTENTRDQYRDSERVGRGRTRSFQRLRELTEPLAELDRARGNPNAGVHRERWHDFDWLDDTQIAAGVRNVAAKVRDGSVERGIGYLIDQAQRSNTSMFHDDTDTTADAGGAGDDSGGSDGRSTNTTDGRRGESSSDCDTGPEDRDNTIDAFGSQPDHIIGHYLEVAAAGANDTMAHMFTVQPQLHRGYAATLWFNDQTGPAPATMGGGG